MTNARKNRAGLTDYEESVEEYAREEERRADARLAAWKRKNPGPEDVTEGA